jgi:DNA-binding NarL/FixJ family response regulator
VITSSIRVQLVDDHAIVREGLHTLLSEESDLEVVGEGPGRRRMRQACRHAAAHRRA